MRYLLLIQMDPDAAGPTGPDERLAEEMGKLLEDMTKAGVLLDTAGLRPIEEATRIRLADGRQTVIDGPFTESKEVIGGYCLLQARSKDEAVEWASRFLALHGPDWEMGMEIRQLDDPLVGGLTTGEIARAYLVSESTVAQRIVRAKRRLTAERVPYEVPHGAKLASRLDSAIEDDLAGSFTAGYTATSGEDCVRVELGRGTVAPGAHRAGPG